MQELLLAVARGLVEDKDAVKVIRVVMRAAAVRVDEKVLVEID